MAETAGPAEGRGSGRAGGGRRARLALRAGAGGAPAVIPGVKRAIPTYELLSEDGLVRIEAAIDTLLQEIGLEFRGDPRSLELWRDAGADVDGERVCGTEAAVARLPTRGGTPPISPWDSRRPT